MEKCAEADTETLWKLLAWVFLSSLLPIIFAESVSRCFRKKVKTSTDANEDVERNENVEDAASKKTFYSRDFTKYRYLWITFVVISTFWIVPTSQFAIKTYISFGETCRYNFKCCWTWGRVPNISSLLTNTTYIVLGLWFTASVWLSVGPASSHIMLRNRSLFMTMGFALAMIGINSLFYHICPTVQTFQIDMSYMVLLIILIMLLLYQKNNAVLSVRVALVLFAFAVLVCAVGVAVNDSLGFWIFSSAAVPVLIFLVAAYMVSQSERKRQSGSPDMQLTDYLTTARSFPAWPTKAKVILAVYLTMNSLYIVYIWLQYGELIVVWACRTTEVKVVALSFSKLGLYWFGLNLFISILVTMALRTMEGGVSAKLTMELLRQHWRASAVSVVMVVFCWMPGLYLYVNHTYDIQISPKDSKCLNKACLIPGHLDMDNHDIWHILSAAGIYLMLMALYLICREKTE